MKLLSGFEFLKFVTRTGGFQVLNFFINRKIIGPGTNGYRETTLEEIPQYALKISSSEALVIQARFSKWNRATAFVFRFISNCRMKVHNKGEFSQEELLKAERYLYQQAHNEKYYAEISYLKNEKSVPKSSEIYKKSPILDKNNVLRADTRVADADIPQDQKQPIILPKFSYITRLIILHFHQRYYHMNHETIINEIRQKYLIPKLRVIFKSILLRCQWCKINKAVPKVPQMAKLPRARLALYTAPFTYSKPP